MVSVPSEAPEKRTPVRHPRRVFQDILDNIGAIQRYTAGLDRESFKANELVIDAVERCSGRISEAAKRLGTTADTIAPDVRWRQMRDFGNILRHEYHLVDLDTVWGIVTVHLDPLEAACQQALATLPPDPPSKRAP